jgi:hypothetical protein
MTTHCEGAGGTPALHGTGPSLLARGIPAGEGFAGAFFDGEEDIHGEVGDGFAEAAGPPDFERVHAGVGAEAEKDARVLRGAVAHAAFGLVITCEVAGDEFQVCADAVAIGFGADEADGEPVVFLWGGFIRVSLGSARDRFRHHLVSSLSKIHDTTGRPTLRSALRG